MPAVKDHLNNPLDTDGISMQELQNMYRAVMVNALQDIGYGEEDDRALVETWVWSESFGVCCELANWNPEWMRDILLSSIDLPDSVRKSIVGDSIAMLKSIMKVTKWQDRSELTVRAGRPLDNVGLVEDIESDPSSTTVGSLYLEGKLGSMSRKMHQRRAAAASDDE